MFQQLLTEILKELTEDIKKDSSLEVLSRCETEADIHSFLRDRLFKTDARTTEFIDKIKNKFASPEKLVTQEMSESEFGELIYECLEKASKGKNSKFSISHHYFSPERDLIIKIKPEGKTEARFRVLTIKTS